MSGEACSAVAIVRVWWHMVPPAGDEICTLLQGHAFGDLFLAAETY